jgi:lipopolysaccharide/colanic/teichoic acid biosynthesis glycosyltransferase
LFNVIKFRSMRRDAEKDGKPRWATKNDDRVTRVGRVIRKLRIDELPQLFSVLAGHMSMVGPRPERAFFVDQLTREIPFYAVRHSVKPGVTGWAQVRYHYGASVDDAAQKLQYDLYYVKNHSLLLDMVILFETVGVVVGGKGAQ